MKMHLFLLFLIICSCNSNKDPLSDGDKFIKLLQENPKRDSMYEPMFLGIPSHLTKEETNTRLLELVESGELELSPEDGFTLPINFENALLEYRGRLAVDFYHDTLYSTALYIEPMENSASSDLGIIYLNNMMTEKYGDPVYKLKEDDGTLIASYWIKNNVTIEVAEDHGIPAVKYRDQKMSERIFDEEFGDEIEAAKKTKDAF